MYLPSRRLVENGPVQEIEHNLQAMNGRSLGADEIEFAVGGDGDGAGGDGDGDGDGAGGGRRGKKMMADTKAFIETLQQWHTTVTWSQWPSHRVT